MQAKSRLEVSLQGMEYKPEIDSESRVQMTALTTTKPNIKMPLTYHYSLVNLVLGKFVFQIWVERKWKKKR